MSRERSSSRTADLVTQTLHDEPVTRGNNPLASATNRVHVLGVTVRSPTLYLTVGLPGAGKTTRAKELAQNLAILRLTPDEWMAPLFGDSDGKGRRDILEGRMVWVAHEVLMSGSSVILDFGCWSPEERYAIRNVADLVGAGFQLEYLVVPEAVRRERCDQRWLDAPGTTFEMTSEDHDRFVELCQPPTAAELAYGPVPDPPEGCRTWAQWASARWPTLPQLEPQRR